MKHLSMGLCCAGFAVLAVGLAALQIVGSPILLMATVCPASMAVALWWHHREPAGPPADPTPGAGESDPTAQDPAARP